MTPVLIIEDELPTAKKLKMLLRQIEPDFQVDAILDSVESASAYFQSPRNIALLFLDIHLADGSAFDFLDRVQIDLPIIFVTAYDQYALQAFKQNSVDYLLKPIDKEELKKSIEKFKKFNTPKVDYAHLVAMIKNQQSPYKKRFALQAGKKVLSINIEEVAYFFAENKAVFLKTKSGREYIVNYTLEKLEQLVDPARFYRVNRNAILCIDSIKSLYQQSKGKWKIELEPKLSFDLFVALDKTGDFKRWMDQ